MPMTDPIFDSRLPIFDSTGRRKWLEELDPIFFVQRDDGLLPVGQPALAEAVAPFLALSVLRADLLDPHVEQLLDRLLDLLLGRPKVDLERVGVVAGELVRTFLGHQGLQDHLVGFEFWAARRLGCHDHDPDSGYAFARPAFRNASSAALVSISRFCLSTV